MSRVAQVNSSDAFQALVTLECLLAGCEFPHAEWERLLDRAGPVEAANALVWAHQAAASLGTDDAERALHLLATIGDT